MRTTPTPAHYVSFCLPQDAQKHLDFLLQKVKAGHEHRPKQWLYSKWLQGTAGEHTLVAMVRYLCMVQQSQDGHTACLARWKLLGWFLSIPKRGTVVHTTAHEAAVIDLIYFNHKDDTLQSIEPCIKLLLHTLSERHAITAHVLMDQVRLAVADDAELKHNISTALRILLKKGTIRSMQPVLDCQFIPSELRNAFHKIIEAVVPNMSTTRKEQESEKEDGSDFERWKAALNESLGPQCVADYITSPDDNATTTEILKAYCRYKTSTRGTEDESLVSILASVVSNVGAKPTAFSGIMTGVTQQILNMASLGQLEDDVDFKVTTAQIAEYGLQLLQHLQVISFAIFTCVMTNFVVISVAI